MGQRVRVSPWAVGPPPGDQLRSAAAGPVAAPKQCQGPSLGSPSSLRKHSRQSPPRHHRTGHHRRLSAKAAEEVSLAHSQWGKAFGSSSRDRGRKVAEQVATTAWSLSRVTGPACEGALKLEQFELITLCTTTNFTIARGDWGRALHLRNTAPASAVLGAAAACS